MTPVASRGAMELIETTDTKPVQCMVAFYPPRYIAEQLARYADRPWNELHITAMYFGDVPNEYKRDYLRVDTMAWAARRKPFSVRISGVGTFNNHNGQTLYASVDIEEQEELRGSLVHAFPGLNASEFGWVPHITLKTRARKFRWLPNIPDLEWTQYRTSFAINSTKFSYDNCVR